MSLEFGVEPAEAVQHVGQVVAPGAGVVDGEVADVQTALTHGGQVGLDADFGGVGRSAQVDDQAFRLGAGGRVRSGHALTVTPNKADDGVVVGVDDEGVAVEGLPVVVGGHGLAGGGDGWGWMVPCGVGVISRCAAPAARMKCRPPRPLAKIDLLFGSASAGFGDAIAELPEVLRVGGDCRGQGRAFE